MTCQLTNFGALYINYWHLNTSCSEHTEENEQSLCLAPLAQVNTLPEINHWTCCPIKAKEPQVSRKDCTRWASVTPAPRIGVCSATDHEARSGCISAVGWATDAAASEEMLFAHLYCPSLTWRGVMSGTIHFSCWENRVTGNWRNGAVIIISLFIILSYSQDEVTSRNH